jgi:spore coat protein U-like protein
MRKQILAPIAAGVLIAFAGAAQAATKTASFTVSASVGKNCVISAGDLALGEFVGDNNLTAQSDITVRCTAGTAFDIALSAGNTGSYAGRRMVGAGGDFLIYNLYTAETYATVWGDDSGTTDVVGGVGAGMGLANELTRTVYGRLLAADNDGPVSAGAYSDTIIATITY